MEIIRPFCSRRNNSLEMCVQGRTSYNSESIHEPKNERVGREGRRCVTARFGKRCMRVSGTRTGREEAVPTIEQSNWHLRQSGRHDRPTSKEERGIGPGGNGERCWDQGILKHRTPPHPGAPGAIQVTARSGQVPIETIDG